MGMSINKKRSSAHPRNLSFLLDVTVKAAPVSFLSHILQIKTLYPMRVLWKKGDIKMVRRQTLLCEMHQSGNRLRPESISRRLLPNYGVPPFTFINSAYRERGRDREKRRAVVLSGSVFWLISTEANPFLEKQLIRARPHHFLYLLPVNKGRARCSPPPPPSKGNNIDFNGATGIFLGGSRSPT